MGSLYTSICPTLCLDGMGETIAQRAVPKVGVLCCDVMVCSKGVVAHYMSYALPHWLLVALLALGCIICPGPAPALVPPSC